MLSKCSTLVFYAFSLVVILCYIDCLQKTEGERHGEINTRLQATVQQQNLKVKPYLRQHNNKGQEDLDQSVQIGRHRKIKRDSAPSDFWRPPPPPDRGPPPPPEPDYSSFDNRNPPHPPPFDSRRPPPPPGSGPPPPPEHDRSPFNNRNPPHHPPSRKPPPPFENSPPPPPEPDHFPFNNEKSPPLFSDNRDNEMRDHRARGRGPPPHARGRGPPLKDSKPSRSNWESDYEDERNSYNKQSDSEINTPTQIEKSADKTKHQDPENSNNSNAVYDKNQGRGAPLANNQGKAENIQQSRPQQQLIQVLPVTPES